MNYLLPRKLKNVVQLCLWMVSWVQCGQIEKATSTLQGQYKRMPLRLESGVLNIMKMLKLTVLIRHQMVGLLGLQKVTLSVSTL